MAINASQFGSGCNARPDPHHPNPLAAAPAGAIRVAGPITRIETARVIGPGWRAVGLRLRSEAEDSRHFEVFLTQGDGRDLVVAIAEEDDAIATWRGLGRSTTLPLVLQTLDGGVIHPYPQLGAVALGQHHYRRQHSFLRHRRPRFLARRKPGAVRTGTR